MADFGRIMMSLLVAVVVAGGLLVGVLPALATEGGGGAYPNGAEDFMSGAVPPPGDYFLNYFTAYSADRFNNSAGKSAVPSFKLNVTGDVLRFIHVTDKQVLGASWAMHLVVPVLNVDVNVPGKHDSRLGVGDILVDPFVLAWHSKNLHAAVGVDVFVPLGVYDKNQLANIGRNYWTFEPVAAVTFLGDNGLDASVKLMYDINTINTATDYTSGHELHFDYAVGQKYKDFTFGAGGFYYQQVTDDKSHGATVPDARGKAVAIGPVLKYDYRKMSFTLKYLMEADARNRTEGNNLWFRFNYAF